MRQELKPIMSDDYALQSVTNWRLRELLEHERDNRVLRIRNRELLKALILCRSALNEVVIASHDLDDPTIHAAATAAQQADSAIAHADGGLVAALRQAIA